MKILWMKSELEDPCWRGSYGCLTNREENKEAGSSDLGVCFLDTLARRDIRTPTT